MSEWVSADGMLVVDRGLNDLATAASFLLVLTWQRQPTGAGGPFHSLFLVRGLEEDIRNGMLSETRMEIVGETGHRWDSETLAGTCDYSSNCNPDVTGSDT